ncbi:dual specificity protein phosphatase [Nocardioides sp.]|uniref:dual specificity protein phosphatase family protein n=1 Tax=Nocardioides sp. TaxID=35761 RepID=UPI00341740F6
MGRGDLESRSSTLAHSQLNELEGAGITAIVDARLEWNDQAWVAEVKPDIDYLWLGVDDGGQRMPDLWFDTGTDHVLAALDGGGTVLVHCHMGINRGPSMGFAAMLALGWDPIEALDRIRRCRPIAYVGYAEDALDWWLRKNGASRDERSGGQQRIRRWRRENHLDVANVIRRIRLKEGA